MMLQFGRRAKVAIFSVGMALFSSEACAETYYLVDDFGVQGKFRRCKYSNGKVYGVPATEPSCYDSIESAPLTLQQPNATTQPGTGSRAFRNCAEVRAAGAAPIRRSDPGYSSKLDRDHDGIGCE